MSLLHGCVIGFTIKVGGLHFKPRLWGAEHPYNPEKFFLALLIKLTIFEDDEALSSMRFFEEHPKQS